MEYGLWRRMLMAAGSSWQVLILVLMEYGLWLKEEAVHLGISLIPS